MADKIESFRDLIVYRKAFELQQEIFETTKNFPKEELFFFNRPNAQIISISWC